MKQTTYTRVALDVVRTDGSVVLTVSVPHAHPERGEVPFDEMMLFPMPAEYAAELGRKLTAPSVVVASKSPIEL